LLLTGCHSVDPDPFTPFVSENVMLTKLPEEEGQLKFLVLGDWGRRGTERQRNVAEQMARVAEKVGAKFVFTTGDNFYNSGVDDVRDSHWRQSFENVYTQPSLQIPWYPALGNHDYRGSVRAQIEYSERSDRWKMPAPYYTFVEDLGNGESVRFIILDTLPLYRTRFNEIKGEGDAHQREAMEQLAWLDSTLAASESDWNLVFGHHPIYSAGAVHGDTDHFIDGLKPILVKHGVQAYFAGHDHSLQHLEDEGEDLEYFVSGAGAKLSGTESHPRAAFMTSRPGFALVALAPEQMLVQFIDSDGNILYGDVLERDESSLEPEEAPAEPAETVTVAPDK
jgi:hypothetical protein